MFFLALAVGVAVGAADDDEWRSQDEKKSKPVRSLSDDWDEEASQPKRTTKPSLRKISSSQADDDFEKPDAKPKSEKWRPPAVKAAPKLTKSSKPMLKPADEAKLDEQIMKIGAVEPENDETLPILGESEPVLKPVLVQAPPEESKPTPTATKLPELPKSLRTPVPATKTIEEPAPKMIQKPSATGLPTLPKPVQATPPAPPSKPLEKPVEKTPEKPLAKPLEKPPVATPIPTPPKPAVGAPKVEMAPVPLVPAPKVMVETPPPTPIPPPGTTVASPPVLMEHGVHEDDSASVCMPLMDAASAWRFESRSFLLWWDQPGTHAFVRDAVTDAGIISGVDYDFEKKFAQQLSLERRFDAATAIVISGLMTEDARQSAGTTAFGALDLGIEGPGSGAFAGLSGFNGRATSRLWKVDVDFVTHYLEQPDSPIRGRFFFGPQFIGLKETYRYHAEGAVGDADFDSRTINTLFGGAAGFGVTFQPWYSNFGIDVSGRYGAFGNVFDARSSFIGPGGTFFGAGEDGTSRFATSAELNVEATLRIARNASLLAGWKLWNIQGVGRAVEQTPLTTASAVLPTFTNGNLFAHGFFIGASFGWGGCADPNSRYGGNRPYILRTE